MAHGFLNGAIYDENVLNCANFIERSCADIIIPAGTKSIGTYAFGGCTSLTSVTIPDSVTSIGTYAFYGCTSLARLEIPDSVTSIGYGAFGGCTSLTSISIPDSVTSIGPNAFGGCSSLTSVTIPDSVTSIGTYAFQGCTSLTSIEIPDSVTSIGNGAFANCSRIALYDFSQCESIVTLNDKDGITINSNTEILVPEELYYDWINSTNWVYHKNCIVTKIVKKAEPDITVFRIYTDASALKAVIDAGFTAGVDNNRCELRSDGTMSYLRIYGDDTSPEAYAYLMNNMNYYTGKYLSFAYRLPRSNAEQHKYFQIYANTTGNIFSGKGDFFELSTIEDGEWHVVVIDLEQAINNHASVVTGEYESQFTSSYGSYTITMLRIDFFNQRTSSDSHVDVAYMGLGDSLELLRSADADVVYDGAEWDATALNSKISDATMCIDDATGIEYVRISSNTGNSTEKTVELHNTQRVLPNVGNYVGILYRNAPDGYVECYTGSNTSNDYMYSSSSAQYDTRAGWHFAVIKLNSKCCDSVCRRFRLDYFNRVSKNTTYSVEIAFIKCFANEYDANAYYENYKERYNI